MTTNERSPNGQALLALVPHHPAPKPAPPSLVDTSCVTLLSVDHDWKFCDISVDASPLLGWDCQYRGSPLLAAVHPDDAPMLLLALGRASAERRGIATLLRMRSHDGGWTPVRCQVSPLCSHQPSRFALALWRVGPNEATESGGQRAARLEGHLWRIALEMKAAGLGGVEPAHEGWWDDPAVRDLSHRQVEILRRLLHGARVPAIAEELFVSQSTVRNHLASIFRKAGVHSQAELIEHLKGAARARTA